MKEFGIGARARACRILAGALASLVLLNPAWADVRTLHPSWKLVPPTDRTYTTFGQAVAINAGSIIVVAGYEGGQAALLYQQTSGKWSFRRVLKAVSGPPVRTSVRMRNGIAAVQFGNEITIFEYSGGTYVASPSAAPILHPGGLAISGNSILIGGDDCDYDAVVYQKGTNGNWDITGRLDDNAGACQPQGLDVELFNDYALLRVPSTEDVHAWRRNGTALAWVRAGDLNVTANVMTFDAAPVLQNLTAVTPGSVVFRRSGTTWTQQGVVMPVDYAMGTYPVHDLKYRDGVLLTAEFPPRGGGYLAHPSAYLETSPGHFEHIAILQTEDNAALNFDNSGNTVVVATERSNGARAVWVFALRTPLQPPPQILKDFEDRDISGFDFRSGQFELATRGTDDVLAQTSTTALAIALLDGSETTGLQRIEADITPSGEPSSTRTRWVGLIARYVDYNNYYYLAIRPDGTYSLYRKQNGTDTLLADGASLGVEPTHVALTAGSDGVHLLIKKQGSSIDGQVFRTVSDTTLSHGRAGVVTYRVPADFDDVNFSATEPVTLALKDWDTFFFDNGRPFGTRGGNWQLRQDEEGNAVAMLQTDTSGYAFATIGTAIASQDITTSAGVNSYGSPSEGAWLGLLGRYVDSKNYYDMIIRNSNEILIRKKVNGVVTTLASENFTITPGGKDYRFRLIGDTLQAFVNGVLVASAHDSEIPSGRYGVGTYRTAATWSYFKVVQP